MSARPRDDAASAVVGAILLFGILSASLVLLNVNSVPAVGRANEEAHYGSVLGALGTLQSGAESLARTQTDGGSASTSFMLGPAVSAGQDFWSIFLAAPARAAGSLDFDPNYGNVTLYHYTSGASTPIMDVGNLTARLPQGRVSFDANPYFRDAATISLENGGVVGTDGLAESLRFQPPITVNQSGSLTRVTIATRMFTGAPANLGGTTGARILLQSEGSTTTQPRDGNAANFTWRMETAHGRAWGAFLNETSGRAGLVSGSGFDLTVARGAGSTGLDVVTWVVAGTGTGNDIALAHSLAAYTVRLS